MTKEYVLGRACQECIDGGDHPHGISFLYEECQHHRNREIKVFPSREEAVRYVYDELQMTIEEVMVIPREEVPDDEQPR